MTYKFKKGDTGLTRGGFPYTVFVVDVRDSWPIEAVITKPEVKFVEIFTSSGRCLNTGDDHPNDLMPPAPTVVREWWANVYQSGFGFWYKTRSEVDDCGHKVRIAVLRRTDWSDGTRTYEEEPL